MPKTIQWRAILGALAISFAVLLFCTKSSPLYPINDWTDANIYLSVGKGMTQGQVVYRDLYDHKGPLLYALHAACALVSFGGFGGVFVMEALLGAWFVYGARRLMAHFGLKRWAWAMSIALFFLICTSLSFAEGDSAEEICLPMMMATMLWACRWNGEGRMPARTLVWHGFLAGCVFWTKFTIIGVHAGLLLWAVARHRKDWWYALGCLAGGFVVSTLPWIIYFGANGAVMDWLKVYLYDNLFLYSAGESAGLLAKGKAMVKCVAGWLAGNLRYTLPLAFGMGYVTLKKKGAALWLALGLGAVSVFVGGKEYPYYGLALAGFAALGLIPVGLWLEKRFAPRALSAAMLAACVALCPVVGHNMTADYGAPALSRREDTMQYQLARYIPQDATLLNYGFMDAGFFTAAGVAPRVKYFHQTNVPLEEMEQEQKRYIADGVCDYVVSRWLLEDEKYELIAQAQSPNFWYETVYLFALRK